MASEVRVNQIQNRSGLGTITVADTGVTVAGITTFLGNVNVSSGSSITVGDKFISSSGIGLGQTTTTGRNAGVGTAIGTIIYNSSTGTVQFYNGSRWLATSEGYIEATGGTISDYTEGNTIYRAHIFTSSGTFSVTSAPSASTVDYLVVAGGGGGSVGSNGGGGGGAGGFRTGTGVPVSAVPGSYSVTVGGGGNGVVGRGIGSNGTSSIFSTITSTGGGRGGGFPAAAGASGGSGGGGMYSDNGGSGNTPPTSPPQGNNGAPGAQIAGKPGLVDQGGGGGGAGGAGSTPNGNGAAGGTGGPGSISSISGTSITYAGGGGGSSNDTTTRTPSAPGGGGDGAGTSPTNGGNGTSNLGGRRSW